jgi:hypothetical protein
VLFDLTRHARREVQGAVVILDVDAADMAPVEAALVGDGPDDLARGDAVAPADIDAEVFHGDRIGPRAAGPILAPGTLVAGAEVRPFRAVRAEGRAVVTRRAVLPGVLARLLLLGPGRALVMGRSLALVAEGAVARA